MPKKKSIHYPQEQSLKPFWCLLVWKESQLGMKNDHIPGAQNDKYPHFKKGATSWLLDSPVTWE